MISSSLLYYILMMSRCDYLASPTNFSCSMILLWQNSTFCSTLIFSLDNYSISLYSLQFSFLSSFSFCFKQLWNYFRRGWIYFRDSMLHRFTSSFISFSSSLYSLIVPLYSSISSCNFLTFFCKNRELEDRFSAAASYALLVSA